MLTKQLKAESALSTNEKQLYFKYRINFRIKKLLGK